MILRKRKIKKIKKLVKFKLYLLIIFINDNKYKIKYYKI